MALNSCVKQILCTLSSAALREIKSILNTQREIIQAQISIYQAQKLQFDIISIPLNSAKAAADLIINKAKKSSALVPISAMAGCADLGDIMVKIQNSISPTISTLEDYSFEASRLGNISISTSGLIDDLNNTLDQFDLLDAVIDECLVS